MLSDKSTGVKRETNGVNAVNLLVFLFCFVFFLILSDLLKFFFIVYCILH